MQVQLTISILCLEEYRIANAIIVNDIRLITMPAGVSRTVLIISQFIPQKNS